MSLLDTIERETRLMAREKAAASTKHEKQETRELDIETRLSAIERELKNLKQAAARKAPKTNAPMHSSPPPPLRPGSQEHELAYLANKIEAMLPSIETIARLVTRLSNQHNGIPGYVKEAESVIEELRTVISILKTPK